MATLNPLLAFAAGALTIMSPCVLPLVPIVLAGAAQKHRWGPFALAAGLVGSFTIVGMTVAVLGATVGFDGEGIRVFGALILAAAGLALIVPQIQAAMTRLATPIANWASTRQQRLAGLGLFGQAAIGVLLGLVWSPCVGPTLGAATALAALGQNIGEVAGVMVAFGCGIASVMLVISLASRSVLTRWRGRMLSTGSRGKPILGAVLFAVGLSIITGVDRRVEGLIVAASPEWLINATTFI